MVDAANACILVGAADLGLQGNELPHEVEADPALMARLAALRATAAVRMGIVPDETAAMALDTIPYLGLVSPPQPALTLAGETLGADAADLTVRFLAGGRVHRAIPLTTALCTAVAARLPGTIAHTFVPADSHGRALRLATPSGVIAADAEVEQRDGHWHAVRGAFLRTARPLFEGRVLVPPGTGR